MKHLIVSSFLFTIVISGKSQAFINNSFKDSNSYAIFSFEKFEPAVFDSSYKDVVLTKAEMKTLEYLFNNCISNYNNQILNSFPLRSKNDSIHELTAEDMMIDLKKRFFFKQLIPVINTRGEKIVWMNCFAVESFQQDVFWKKEILNIADGGNDNFTLLINLSKNECSSVQIGGYG